MVYTLADLAQHIGATVNGDDSITVSSLATLAGAKTGQIAFWPIVNINNNFPLLRLVQLSYQKIV